MALSDAEKKRLRDLKTYFQNQLSLGTEVVAALNDVLDLSYITPRDLKGVSNPTFTASLDFKTIDTAPPFTTTDMNFLAPGAIDVVDLRKKMMNQSMLQGATGDVVNTESGAMAVSSKYQLNHDVEDLMAARAVSQGINLQNINRARFIDPVEAKISNSVPSMFVENQYE